MKSQIEEKLQYLIGLEMTNNGGAANMEMIQFGTYLVNEKNGFITGYYGLHVQCPWRIIQDGKIFVAYFDLYQPDEAQKDLPYEEFDEYKGSLRHQQLRILTRGERKRLKVERVEADDLGGFTLHFTQNTRMEVLPMHSCEIEYWRLIRHQDKAHFVVEKSGIYDSF